MMYLQEAWCHKKKSERYKRFRRASKLTPELCHSSSALNSYIEV
jgi:hypothetical protein